MAAKAVELVQLVGRVAGAGPHLPEVVQIDSANNCGKWFSSDRQCKQSRSRWKQNRQRSWNAFTKMHLYTSCKKVKRLKQANANLAVAVSSSLQPVQEKW